MRPLVVLANPYNVALTGSWWLKVGGLSAQLRMGDFPAASPPPDYPESGDLGSFPDSVNLSGNADPARNYNDRLNLVFKDVTLPAGEAVIFCLKQDYGDPGGSASPLEVEMAEGLDELTNFTWATGSTLADAAPDTRYVALYTPQSRVEAWLYAADPADNPSGQPHGNLLCYIYGQPAAADGACFLVPPVSSGSAEGGGSWFVMRDALLTGGAGSFPRQMSPFVQYNYRAVYNINAGYGGTANHVLEPARTFTQKNASNAPEKFLNDLLLDSSGDRVRWGRSRRASSAPRPPRRPGSAPTPGSRTFSTMSPAPAARSYPSGSYSTSAPAGFIAGGRAGGSGTGDPKSFAVTANTFQLNYPLANSYANPWVGRDRVLDASGKSGIQYDASWLFNEALADRFFFSSYPAAGAVDLATDKLVNARLRPFRDRSVVAWDDETAFRGSARAAAKNLLVDGAFNINSTSVEAWKAVLSGLRGVPVEGDSGVNVPFTRTLYPSESHAGARNGNSKDAWAGFSNLSDGEIDDLAREIVLQIRRRGPFLSLSDFINRRLVSGDDDPAAFRLGASGALQAAVDAVVNLQGNVDPALRVQSSTSSFADTVRPTDFRLSTMTAGAPGYLLQGDLLSPLAPTLSARSDTFVIRAYGDAWNPATGETTGQAWCEAVVQRLPDYVVAKSAGGNDPEEIPAANTTNERFGRRYQVVSFRWLSPDDI